MPTKPKSPKKAKRVNREVEAAALGIELLRRYEGQIKGLKDRAEILQQANKELVAQARAADERAEALSGEPDKSLRSIATLEFGVLREEFPQCSARHIIHQGIVLLRQRAEDAEKALAATERHNAELLREVEELRTKRFEIVGPNGEPYVPQAGDMLVGYRPGDFIPVKRQPRLFGNRLRALLSTFSRKGMSAAE